MRRATYSPWQWLVSAAVLVTCWVVFFVSIGFLSRVAKELFCVGFGC